MPLLPKTAEFQADLGAWFGIAATNAAQNQLPSGLWSAYLDEPELTPDTSGSAGIAAAFALGVKNGYLPAKLYLEPAPCLHCPRRLPHP